MSIFKGTLLIFSLLFFFSCKKTEVRVLKKGNWNLEWKHSSFTQTAKLHFKGNGKGVYYPTGTSDKVPFNYSISESSATFQFESPNNSNTVHSFDIVIEEDDYQVWEENYNSTIGDKSTFVIKK